MNKNSFKHASTATYEIFGYSFLNCDVKLDFCLKNNKDLPIFLDLILCNIYNYSININLFFDMLNNLPDLEKLFTI